MAQDIIRQTETFLEFGEDGTGELGVANSRWKTSVHAFEERIEIGDLSCERRFKHIQATGIRLEHNRLREKHVLLLRRSFACAGFAAGAAEASLKIARFNSSQNTRQLADQGGSQRPPAYSKQMPPSCIGCQRSQNHSDQQNVEGKRELGHMTRLSGRQHEAATREHHSISGYSWRSTLTGGLATHTVSHSIPGNGAPLPPKKVP